MTPPSPPALARVSVGLALALLLHGGARAEDHIDWSRDGFLPRDFDFTGVNPTVPRTHRIRLPGFQPGFISDPVGLNSDDFGPAPDPLGRGEPPPASETGPDWVGLSMGADNPFFDFRRAGDPGGVGYYRV